MDYSYSANLPINWQALNTGIDDEMEPLEPDDNTGEI